MKKRDEVLALFRGKYDYLKSIYPWVGPFVENNLSQLPDGGWQINLAHSAAITLRPGSDEPHETHGGIYEQWYQEGGAFDENKMPGWLGHPVSDEEAYKIDGDPADRISHFENGDIVWTAKTNEKRIFKKNTNEIKMTPLNSKRGEIIQPLEGLRGLVKRPGNGLEDSRAKDMERSIDSVQRSICYDRYRVTVFGAFSAGKSTLLNALIGSDYLPSADLPTTNVTTEIFRSEQFYVFMPNCDITKAQAIALQEEVSTEIPGGTFLESLERDGQTISGVGVAFQPNNSKEFRKVIEQLADQQSCHETGLPKFKKRIKDGSSTVLQLGIPNLPEWLGEITLTDAPGAGSVYKGHESIIDDIIPKTQLVLYVVESPKAGSSVDEWLCNRIMNSYRRKVFFVLNKIDQQNDDEIDDALAELKEHIPPSRAGSDGEPPPPKPEFLKCSALCETVANRLSDGSATIANLIDNKKLSISKLYFSSEWTTASNDEERRNAAIRFLRKQSQFDKLRERIKSYLHEENKDFPFCEKSEVIVKTFGQELKQVAQTTIELLRKDTSHKELEHKQQELRHMRDRSANEARSALEDFRESALSPDMGVLSKVKNKLSEIPTAVAKKLEEVFDDSGEFKRLTANKGEELKSWLAREVADRMEPISRSLDGELRRQGEHLIRRLRPILEKIDNATLAHQSISILTGIKEPSANYSEICENADKNIQTATVAAGVSGGALAAVLGLTVGMVTSTTTIAGTGLAGILGTGWLASAAAWLGWGTAASTLTTTAPFWGLGLGPMVAIVALVAVAVAIPTTFLANNIIRKKIVSKVEEELTKQLVGNENDSVIKKIRAKVNAYMNGAVDGCRKNLDAYLDNLDKQEKKILDDVEKAKEVKGERIKSLQSFREEVENFIMTSIDSLQTLNPEKEPVHG